MNTISFRMPEDLEAAIAAQAERAGISLNQYLLSIVAAHAGSQAKAERYFAARAACSNPVRATEILARAGQDHPPEPGDGLPPDLVP